MSIYCLEVPRKYLGFVSHLSYTVIPESKTKGPPRMTNKMKRFSLKMYTVLTTLLTVALLNTFFPSSQATIKQQTITVIELSVKYRLAEIHIIQYVEKPVTTIKFIERIQKVPLELRNFSDIRELKQWPVAVDTNTTTVYFQLPDAPVDYDDYALTLQRKVLRNGHILSLEVISRSEYNTVFKSKLPPSQRLHTTSLVIIGNDACYIEPQTNKIGFTTHID